MRDEWTDYELIDFGAGRKLERFGPWTLDRPCPAADSSPACDRSTWTAAVARYDGPRATDGTWHPPVERWPQRAATVDVHLDQGRAFRMGLEPLPSGQIGLFPEQWPCWRWIAEHAQRGSAAAKVLNLFAYTGGSTLAAAVAGAEVTHVDAARSVVERARQNAAASGLAEHPIRWIVDDAMKFCRREVKRGRRYDAIVLDPPTYGHGPGGEAWQIHRDLLPLLELCGELVERQPALVLATCHTPSLGPAELAAYLCEGVFGQCSQGPRTGELSVATRDGRRLASGVYARWPG